MFWALIKKIQHLVKYYNFLMLFFPLDFYTSITILSSIVAGIYHITKFGIVTGKNTIFEISKRSKGLFFFLNVILWIEMKWISPRLTSFWHLYISTVTSREEITVQKAGLGDSDAASQTTRVRSLEHLRCQVARL